MTTPNSNPFGASPPAPDGKPADPAPSPAGETLDEQIARLTAERDAQKAAEPPPPPAADRKVGDLVRFEADSGGAVRRGLATVTEVVEPYDKGDGKMSDVQYLVAPLTELGVYLDGHQLTDP